MSKLYFKTDQGDRFAILRGSHIAFKQAGKEDLFCAWEAVSSIHGDLDRTLAQGEEMLERVKKPL